MLENLAAVDPKKALARALAEKNLKLSEMLEQAALRGWGKVSPSNAANWALALPDPSARETALSSVFAGAASGNPEAGVAACNLACQQNPGEATGYGSKLIDALCETGNYALAAQFSQSGEDAAQKSMWMAEAYSKWAELQPEQAGTAATAIVDAAARTEALHGVVGGWAAANPAGLAQFLAQLPAGSDRGLMLGQALQSWVGQDPVAAANWINDNQTAFGQDLDQGMKAVAMLDSISPSQAVNWAEGIGNNELRSAALADILRNWLQTDFSGARNYFQNTANLMPAERQQLSEIIAGINTRTTSQ
jgi:hypothetical protein